ncbi:glycoside hydrolase family 88/105 protein [Phenylobacterium deserti]|uniref:Glucuronyl hydrolase n=1 Tax=Phenylobacterium deserti TaxID=1914756 RepID=A0A328AD35_9CAUL|nr:glycoside hydrolase family 88 protein [Phenylobacterium deserti]RAK52550.1 glucuronyl hydrolase [Phenylobacterium deserti]
MASWRKSGAALLLAAAAITTPLSSPPAQAQPARAQADAATVLTAMERVGAWQIAHLSDFGYVRTFRDHTEEPRGWIQGAFYVGLAQLAARSPDPRFREALVAKGRAEGWDLGPRTYHADDHVIGRAWLWAAENAGQKEALPVVRARLDRVLAAPPRTTLDFAAGGSPGAACSDRWCWSDALFMAPPLWAEMTRLTGDPKYLAYADAEWQAVSALLYDPASHLYYRDSRFIGQRGPKGEKIFWSRGNGWSYAGLVAMLKSLPKNHPSRPRYEAQFRQMSDRVIQLQGSEGYWPVSLEGGPGATPETSGTGFFTYGLAFGLNSGLLDASYRPAVERGWAALARAVRPDGRLGWVQQVGEAPDHVLPDDTQLFGVGAFLLAGSEVYDLKRRL